MSKARAHRPYGGNEDYFLRGYNDTIAVERNGIALYVENEYHIWELPRIPLSLIPTQPKFVSILRVLARQ